MKASFGTTTRIRTTTMATTTKPPMMEKKPMKKRPLVVVGSINADFVLQVPRIPAPGETLNASSLALFPGGKGANQAAAAGRLGYPTHLIGQCGGDGDTNAAFMLRHLDASSVSTSGVKRIDGIDTGSAYIFLVPSGENSIVIVGGANQHAWRFTDDDRALMAGAGAVLLQREIPESANIQVAQFCKTEGVPVILDAGGVDDPLDRALLSNVTILSPNESELARLTGMPTATEAETVEAAKRLMAGFDVKHVLVKLGARGSMLLSDDGTQLRQQALPVPKVVDTTGAGDCFTAAFALGFVQGWPHDKCLRFASAAAGMCIQEKGAMSSLPFLSQITDAHPDEFL